MIAVLETKRTYIPFTGMNMSIIQKQSSNGYLGIIRQRVDLTPGIYPEVQNIQYLLELDEDFRILKYAELKEPQRTTHISFTTGLEDGRLLSETMIVAVLLDTNPNWIPQISFCSFDSESATISKITPMVFEEDPNLPQKNWIFLKQEKQYFMIYSYSPIRVIECDLETGTAILSNTGKNKIQLPEQYKNSHFHGGSAVQLETGEYLVAIRIVQEHEYKFSMWLLLDSSYEMVGYSAPFLFQEKNATDFFYEMCMSLFIREQTLIASVSIADKDVFVYEMELSQVLDSILENSVI